MMEPLPKPIARRSGSTGGVKTEVNPGPYGGVTHTMENLQMQSSALNSDSKMGLKKSTKMKCRLKGLLWYNFRSHFSATRNLGLRQSGPIGANYKKECVERMRYLAHKYFAEKYQTRAGFVFSSFGHVDRNADGFISMTEIKKFFIRRNLEPMCMPNLPAAIVDYFDLWDSWLL